jgi:hypothetical protein
MAQLKPCPPEEEWVITQALKVGHYKGWEMLGLLGVVIAGAR